MATDLLDTPDAGPAAIRGGAMRTAGYLAGLLLALGSAPIIFRHLGPAEFGRYTSVLALITLAAGFSEGGLNAIAQREWSTRPPAERGRLMQNLLGIRIVLTVVAVAAALAFAVVAGYDGALIAGTALAGAGMMGVTLQSLLASPLQADLRFGWATTAELLRQVVFVACVIGLVVAGQGLVPLLAAQIPAALAALALTAWLVRGSVPLRPRTEGRIWRPLLRDTLPFAVAIAVNAAYFRIALLFMSIATTELETGYFAASFRIMEVLLAVPPILLAVAFPILSRSARDDADRFAYVTGRTIEVALIVGALVVVAVELGAQVAIDVLAGADYEEAVPVLRIQAPALLATFVAVACSYPLLSLRGHREVLIANLLALAVTLIGLFVLVPAYDAHGAAVATLLAEIALAVAAAVLLRRAAPHVRLPLATAAIVLAVGGASIGVAALTGLPDVARLAIGLALCCAGLLVTRRVPVELFQAVRR